jgi:hypothetical protein
LDHLVVARTRTRCRQLRAPASSPKAAAQGPVVVRNAESLADHVGDAPQRPAVGVVPVCERASREGRQHLVPLLGRQPRLAPFGRTVLERRERAAGCREPGRPLADGSGADADLASDLGLRQLALLEKTTGIQPPLLFLLRR